MLNQHVSTVLSNRHETTIVLLAMKRAFCSTVNRKKRRSAFYLHQQAMGIMSKEEWPVFMNTLKDPLPACFRIHSDCSFKDQ